MERKLAGLVGGVAALATVTAADAAPLSPTPAAATSYRDLLEPVPDAIAAVKADDARMTAALANNPLQLVQWSYYRRHPPITPHHHHHHHRFGFRW